MSNNTKFNILLITTILTYGLLFAILLLGYFFPGDPGPNQAPWYVWAAIGEVLAIGIATISIFVIAKKKDRQLKEHKDDE